MSDTRQPGADSGSARRANNFGLLRLVLASLVILSHSPELIDGNRSRELLTQLFGTISFGGLAVDGFFIISGFLITKSWVQDPSIVEFTIKRLARIVPGFVVSFLICVFMIAPLVGAGSSPFGSSEFLRLALTMLRLATPNVPGVFPDLPYPALNGSMWTISYEMRCYVLALGAGLVGLYGPRTRTHYLLIVAGLFLFVAIDGFSIFSHLSFRGKSQVEMLCRLTVLFGSGGVFYLFRDSLSLTVTGASISVGIIALAFTSAATIEPALAVFGSYLIFTIALKAPATWLSAATNRTDISYGVYLYAFPIQNVLIYAFDIRNPWLLSLLTFPIAFVAGFLSWTLIESPVLHWSKRWSRSRRIARSDPTVLQEASAT